MPSNGPLNHLKIAKLRMASYSSQFSDNEDASDLEKRLSLSDSDYITSPNSASTASSRVTSKSYEPMLRRSSDSSPSRKAKYQFSHSRPRWCRCGPLSPRMSSRIFSLALFSFIVIFILSLTRLHWASIRNVDSGKLKLLARPPPWEKFPFLKRYHGGIRTLVPKASNKPEYPTSEDDELIMKAVQEKGKLEKRLPPGDTFDPYPKYTAEEGQEYSPVQECFLDEEKSVRVPPLRVFNGVPEGMPDPVMGSFSLLGLRDDVCFERFGRLGPYGYGYSKKMGGSGAGMEGDRENAELVWEEVDYVDYNTVRWGEATKRCEVANQDRFERLPKHRNHFYQTMAAGGPADELSADLNSESSDKPADLPLENDASNTTMNVPRSASKKLLPRTAVLIRTWHDYKYDEEDLFYLRSLIAELALHSGGEYTIHFLIHVKDSNLQIWADDATYDRVLKQALPEEFHGMGTLWSERQMELIYGGLAETNYRNLKVHGVYRSTFQPVTYFALQHPEYAYFWQLEVDARYTGHWYHLFSKSTEWSKQQPRKGLWERNSRFYIPSEHGSWEDFSHMVRVQTEHGTASKSNMYASLANNPHVPESVKNSMKPPKPERPVWGPLPPIDDALDVNNDVKPPHDEKEDKHEWGVGEDADLILFNPIFDPEGTNWILAQDVTGYNTTRGLPPRRVAINTFGRYSRKLLIQMHKDTSLGRKSMFSEMWPASCALHHGFKAVYAPHPVFIDRRWPTPYLASIFNGGRNGQSGGSRMSVFSDERQHNFRGTTWYYDAGFAPNLWKRWLGLKVDGDGGEAAEADGEGRMCLPAVLLHPVKQVDLVLEKIVDVV
jgi:hypothetical protein